LADRRDHDDRFNDLGNDPHDALQEDLLSEWEPRLRSAHPGRLPTAENHAAEVGQGVRPRLFRIWPVAGKIRVADAWIEVPEPAMPTIDIPEATYQRLTRRAAALRTTVESLAVPALEELARDPAMPALPTTDSPVDLPYDEWKKLFGEIVSRAEARKLLYPPGFVADVSRESIYEGCGE